jgi:ADP-dependent NAD(P)H-hydrate dehydratase
VESPDKTRVNFVETSADMLSLLPPRNPEARKGDNGLVLVVGGNRFYHGAPVFSALAAARCGADLVFLAVPNVIVNPVRSYTPDYIVFPLPDDRLTTGSVRKLLKWLPKIHSAVIGPGMGRQRLDALQFLIRELLSRNVKLVIDADAIVPDIVKVAKGKQVVFTPHPGEFRRGFQSEFGNTIESKTEAVKRAAEVNSVTIVVKGFIDVVSDGSSVFVDRQGSAGMTIGGTGDALSGIISALLAKGIDEVHAGAIGTYIVGVAGSFACNRLGFHIVATDLIDEIPNVLRRFDRVEGEIPKE